MFTTLVCRIEYVYCAWIFTQQINKLRKDWWSLMEEVIDIIYNLECTSCPYFKKAISLLEDAGHSIGEAIGRLDMAKEYEWKYNPELACVNFDCALGKFDDYKKLMHQSHIEFEQVYAQLKDEVA